MTPTLTGALEAENEELRERIAELEKIAFATDWTPPAQWRLMAVEARIFGLLLQRRSATSEQVAYAIWALRPGKEIASREHVSVRMCGLRKKLKPFGVTIRTMWGQGFELDPADRRRLLESERQAKPCRP